MLPFVVEPEYLKHQGNTDHLTPDFRHWQIPCGRRFRAMKLWFVIRMYGVTGLQEGIRKQVAYGNQFAALVKNEPSFELISNRMGVVAFRLKVIFSLSTVHSIFERTFFLGTQ